MSAPHQQKGSPQGNKRVRLGADKLRMADRNVRPTGETASRSSADALTPHNRSENCPPHWRWICKLFAAHDQRGEGYPRGRNITRIRSNPWSGIHGSETASL